MWSGQIFVQLVNFRRCAILCTILPPSTWSVYYTSIYVYLNNEAM